MNLDELRIFVAVAELASFTRAAEQLSLAKARVSTAIQQLESRLGTRLLQRTTRRVMLTPDGEQFLARCQDFLADAEHLQAMFQPQASGLRGRLRLDLPTTIARDTVVPRLPEFLARHPLLELGLSTTDRRVDLVHEGFDCVIRVGPLADSELIARPLGRLRMVNLASPAYLDRHGTPTGLDDLARHHIVHYASSLSSRGACWEVHDAASGRTRMLPMRAALTVNGIDAYQAACVAGLGLIQAPASGTRRLVESGTLVEILPDLTAAPMPLALLHASRRQLAPRVQALMAWLAEILTPLLGPV